MKKLYLALGVAGLLCGCHTQRDTGASSTSYESGYGGNVQTNSRSSSGFNQTNNPTQGTGAENLTNTNSPPSSNP